MNQQPELPDFVRDLEIVQSLNRYLFVDEDMLDDTEQIDALEVSDDSVSV